MQPDFNVASLRETIAQLSTDHDASGAQQPTPGEVFAPRQHASALATSTLIVVGARGAGKSFWAGVLGQDSTRQLAAEVYPNLQLDKLIVRFGYTGFAGSTGVSKKTIDSHTSTADHDGVVDFWRLVILRAALDAVGDPRGQKTIGELAAEFSEPELLERYLRSLDRQIEAMDKTVLVVFDALDTLARDWRKLTLLTDALFEAVWLLRAYSSIRAKIFIRPDQLNDEGLRFVELPKLRNGRVELNWTRRDLYGLLFCRIAEAEQERDVWDFNSLSAAEGAPVPSTEADKLKKWALSLYEERQKRMMERLSGLFMGNGSNKGATYPWTYNHLADARGVVTPRSFLKLFVEAALYTGPSASLVLTPEAIRHGLREASKTRVEQLALEYPWIKRALAPLAGLKVPCQRWEIHDLWSISDTAEIIEKAAEQEGFLPPYVQSTEMSRELALEFALERIGVISYRPDGRADIPDLFRIAARMFKLGGVALQTKE